MPQHAQYALYSIAPFDRNCLPRIEAKGRAVLFLKIGWRGKDCRSLHYAPTELRSG
jgi:hypothetical protein